MILCPNCHSQLQDSAAFCHNCGTQLAQQNYAPQQGYGYPEQQPQYPQYPQYQQYQQYQQPVPPKKKNKGLVIGIIAAVLVVLAIIGSVAEKAFQSMGYGDVSDDVRGDIVSGDASSSSQESQPEFSLGKAANGVYKNDFLGLSCTVPASWEFYTDEQILEMNNIAAQYYDEDIAEQLQNAAIIYDMIATDPGTGNNININLEKLTPVQAMSMDIKQTLEAQIDSIKSVYANMGYTNTEVQYRKVTVDGRELDGLFITANIQGMDLYAASFAFMKGSYLANVSITAMQTDKTAEILGYFSFD